MHRRKSFLFRLFALLFALLLLITAPWSWLFTTTPARWWGRSTSASTSGPAADQLHPCQGMTDTQTLAKRIAESTQLIELLSGPAGERADEAATICSTA